MSDSSSRPPTATEFVERRRERLDLLVLVDRIQRLENKLEDHMSHEEDMIHKLAMHAEQLSSINLDSVKELIVILKSIKFTRSFSVTAAFLVAGAYSLIQLAIDFFKER